jgi:hypothetical protein
VPKPSSISHSRCSKEINNELHGGRPAIITVVIAAASLILGERNADGYMGRINRRE